MKLSPSQKEQLLSEVTFSASRGSGPGGQNVNKVSTKVELRFRLFDSEILTQTQKQRLASKLKNRLTTNGEMLLFSETERSQWRNRKAVEQKFLELVEKALTPAKRRIKTKPTAASKRKRIENKKKHARKKQLRKPPES